MDPSRSTDTDAQSIRIVVVDDDPQIAELYASWLEPDYQVATATSGQAGLEAVDDRTDIVFLDRKMPDISGDAALRKLRRRDKDCLVAMVTAVKPDVDIVDMGFDEYICKPIEKEDLRDLVEVLLARSQYDEKRQKSFALASKKAILETVHDRAELEQHDEYQTLLAKLEANEAGLQRTLEELIEKDDASWAFRTLGTDEDERSFADSS